MLQSFLKATRAEDGAQFIELHLFAYIEKKKAHGRAAKSGMRSGVHEAISLTRGRVHSLGGS